MDLNLVVVGGRVAVEPEVRVVDTGSRVLRLLVVVKSMSPRRRIDVLPVALWDPREDIVNPGFEIADPVWVVGSVQRRLWDEPWLSGPRIEVIAQHVAPQPVASPDP